MPRKGQITRNLVGSTYGFLTVMSFFGRRKSGQALYFVHCNKCNQYCVMQSHGIIRAKYCNGCRLKNQPALAAQMGKANKTHGHSRVGDKKHLEYSSYRSAQRRCTNPKTKYWENYGGRGIQFLFTSLEEFIEALKTPDNPTGLKPSPKHSIDRIDNDWHYGVRPDGTSNIRWATRKTQANNRRRPSKRKSPAPVPLPAEVAMAA